VQELSKINEQQNDLIDAQLQIIKDLATRVEKLESGVGSRELGVGSK